MNVGYSYWGYLGDTKYNSEGNEVSTPDGNAFYSWSIIKQLQDEKYNVVSIMPDRDAVGFAKRKGELFSSWCQGDRIDSYLNMDKCKYNDFTEKELFKVWDDKIKDADFVLLEWRFEILGRNDVATKILYEIGDKELNWQPDFYIQEELIKYCSLNNIKIIVFDLDYKLTKKDVEKYNIRYIIELGTKWQQECLNDVKVKQVEIPFSFSNIDYFSVKKNLLNNLIYVGNRYERDWCINKYIPEDMQGVKVYGNWKESGRDSEQRWPFIDFGKRLQTGEMRDAYKDYIATILLAKEDYCKYSFMTARLIESIFYGVVPLFINEFGTDTIKKYAGAYAEILTVNCKQDVKNIVGVLRNKPELRMGIIRYLRNRLLFMDAKYFVKELEKMISEAEG